MSHYCPFSTVEGLGGKGSFGFDYCCTSGTTCTASLFPGSEREDYPLALCKWGEGSSSAWGSGLYHTPRDLPTGPSSVTAATLHPCHGLKIDLQKGEGMMISGLTTAWTFTTARSPLRPDFWQEKQIPHLRFPFKDFSQPSFNSASCSIMQGTTPLHCHLPATTPLSRQTALSLCPMWTWWQSGGTYRGASGWPWQPLGFACCCISCSPSPPASVSDN